MIASRLFKVESRFTSEWVREHPEIGGLGGPLRFAALLQGAQLVDGAHAKLLTAQRGTETTEERVDPATGDVIVETSIQVDGLLPEERLPQGWRAFFCAP